MQLRHPVIQLVLTVVEVVTAPTALEILSSQLNYLELSFAQN